MTEEASKQIEAYINNLTSIFLSVKNYTDEDTELIVDYGRKIAYAKYDGVDGIGLYGGSISDELKKLRPDLYNGDILMYFGMCRAAGENIAKGTPGEIDSILNSMVRIERDTNSFKP